MPPYLNIYVLTPRRDREAIDSFLSAFVDVAASEDLGDTELMMLPLGHTGPLDGLDVTWEWRPCSTLSEAIQIGLGPPPRAFTLALKSCLEGIHHPTLTFTRDQQLLLGVAVEDDHPRAEPAADVILGEMMLEFGATCGLIGAELAPPMDEDALRALAASRHGVIRALVEPLIER